MHIVERTLSESLILHIMIVKENMAFTKMKSICELQERHGVMLGTGYKNDKACATFVEFIAKEQQELLVSALSRSKFFSFQADASTDTGNVEIELCLVVYFDPLSSDGQVHVRNRFFCVRHLSSGTGTGLFDCFEKAMEYMKLEAWKTKMIDLGCDGTNANIADGGLKGLLQCEVPWVCVFWCLSHRLELSLKDALKSTFFDTIDDLLLRMYYIYEKSPKKCRALDDIVFELKSCFEQSEVPLKGGIRPLRACGTWFIAHKVAALERMIDRFGAYLTHFVAMTEDDSVKAVDKQKINGYILKWRDSKVLLGCAFFHDLLKSTSILCKVLQEDDVCVVQAIESIFKVKKSLDKLSTTTLEEFPSVKMVLGRLRNEVDGLFYQGVELKHHDRAMDYLTSNYVNWIDSVKTCLKDRIRFQDIDLLTHAVTLLATKGWERSDSTSFGYEALDAICDRFQAPLENASVNCSLVQEEWDDMVDYAKNTLTLYNWITK